MLSINDNTLKQTDKGIFIHRINYSDTSLIVSFYTEKKGIQKFIYPGGKKKAHALFPLSICEIGFYIRPDSELGKLTDADPSVALSNIPAEPIRSSVAFFIADILQNCLKFDVKDVALFHFLEESIEALNTKNDLSLFAIEFMLGMTVHLGIDPTVDPTNKSYFILEDGEFSSIVPSQKTFTEGTGVQIIQDLLRGNMQQQLNKEERNEALQVMIDYYRMHIPRFNVERTLEIIRAVLYT